jgi:DNA-binding transcriptional LysR family regulator
MNIQQIRQFIGIAKAGSILKASEKLFITHQALGRSLHNLEEELGAPLFVKTGSGCQLTEFGSKILPVAESMIAKYNEYADLILSLAGQNRQAITISLEHNMHIYALPTDLISRYDAMNTRFLAAGNRANCAGDVLQGRADLGVCLGNCGNGELEHITFFREPIAMIMRKDHYLAKKRNLNIPDLRGVSLIGLRLDSTQLSPAFINACMAEGFYPNYVLESSDLELIRRTVLTRNAVMPLASYVITEFSSDELVTRPLAHDTLRVELNFLLRKNIKQKALVRSFINAVLNYYKEGLS